MNIELKYDGGMTFDKSYHRKYTHVPTGIGKEIFTKRNNRGIPVSGSQEVTWYHPKDKNTHDNFQAALQSAVNLRLVPFDKAAPFLIA